MTSSTTAHSPSVEGSNAYRSKIGHLTLDQKISLISGKNFWTTVAIPEAGIPQLKVTDGPIGARGDLANHVPSACFPSGSGIGATWDPQLVAEIAGALAEETKLKGAHVLLGPAINLQRTPIGGRNFECYSEDPHLTAELAVAYVGALQSGGVGACPKHYVGNDTEYQRFLISSNIDDATLHEVYLYPFERVTKETRPWMIMAAYNAVNGIQACSHRALNVDLLKKEWGFDGVIVSDWFAARNTVGNANGGLDLEMPGPSRIWGADLKTAIEKGEVSEAELDNKVGRLLHLMDRSQPHPELQHETGLDKVEHRALIRRAAAEGMVLLKNEGKTLPLDANAVKSIAVIGPNAEIGQIMGGGSAFVNSHPPVHPLEGIRNAFPNADIQHAVGCTNHKFLPSFPKGTIKTESGEEGFWEERFEKDDFSGEPVAAKRVGVGRALLAGVEIDKEAGPEPKSLRLTGHFSPRASGLRELGLFSAGPARLLVDNELVVDNWSDWKPGESFFGFGSDEIRALYTFEAGHRYKITVEYVKSAGAILAGAQFGISTKLEEDAIAHAAGVAAAADRAILVLGSNSDWETEGHDRTDMALPGEQDALAEAVLAANPNTVILMNVGSPVTMPWYEKARTVLVTWFPGEEMGNAIGDVVTGQAEPSGRLPFTWPKRIEDHPCYDTYPGTEDLQMPYSEGRLIGHRWYEKKGVEPIAFFGHGLGYGDASIESVDVMESSKNDIHSTVSVSLKNAADRATRAVVQVYAEPSEKDAGEDTPPRKLVGFRKVDISANGKAVAEIDVLNTSLAEWNPEIQGRVVPSSVSLVAGLSSNDIAK
ncbi:MAG: glycoside hydrolase family 3 C-terminal domain-containing protein [Pseudomonadota bacterium]